MKTAFTHISHDMKIGNVIKRNDKINTSIFIECLETIKKYTITLTTVQIEFLNFQIQNTRYSV